METTIHPRFLRVLSAALAAAAIALVGCGPEPDSTAENDATDASSSSGQVIDSRVVGSASITDPSKTTTIAVSTGHYAGATVTVASGAFAKPSELTVVELAALRVAGADEAVEIPSLVLITDTTLPEDGITVELNRPLPQDAHWFAYVEGAGGWVKLETTEPKADGGALALAAKLGTAFSNAAKMKKFVTLAADVDIKGLAKDAVVGAFGIGYSLAKEQLVQVKDEIVDLADKLAKKSAAVLAAATEPLINLAQPPALFAPGALGAGGNENLLDWLCGKKQGVVVAHGIMSNPQQFLSDSDIIVGLQAQGWSTGAFAYPSGLSIESNGKALATLLDITCPKPAQGPYPPPHAVGHSMGGLVLRAAVQFHGAEKLLDRIVMLATPNNGGDNTLLVNSSAKVFGESVKEIVKLPLPGLNDLMFKSLFLLKVNNASSVTKQSSRYFTISGWSANSGSGATDGWVELKSALALDLPPGHEWYISTVSGKGITAHEHSSTDYKNWVGGPLDWLDHNAIHAKAKFNQVLPLLNTIFLRAPACDSSYAPSMCKGNTWVHCGSGSVPKEVDCAALGGTCGWDIKQGANACSVPCSPACKDKKCGDDGCGGSCGSCASDKTCSNTGQCIDPPVKPPFGNFLNVSNGATLSGKQFEVVVEVIPGDSNLSKVTLHISDGSKLVFDESRSLNAAVKRSKYTTKFTVDTTGQANGLGALGPGWKSGAYSMVLWAKDANQAVAVAELTFTFSGECAPSCAGKDCGPDGCGGSCGTCGSGKTCNASKCVTGSCVPSCSGKECGSDGCNGSCGTCEFGATCNLGKCTPASSLMCVDTASMSECTDPSGNPCKCVGCNPDGSCGLDDDCVCADCVADSYCSNSANCNNDGSCDPYNEGCKCADCAKHPLCPTCTPSCSGKECGPDGCGGSCGTCGAGKTCSNGFCTSGSAGCWPNCPEMVPVPAGSFWMGCNEAVDNQCDSDEYPYHEVYLDGFEVDTTETTVTAYQACVQAGSCTVPYAGGSWCPTTKYGTYGAAGKQSHPVNCVTWHQAKAYCEWAGKRLCTEAEWEKAARGTDGRKFPWGNAPASCDYAIFSTSAGKGCGADSTWPVGSKPLGASPYGALDMAGNVWEWVADWYNKNYYDTSPTSNPTGPAGGSSRVFRGGSFGYTAAGLRASGRDVGSPASTSRHLGFRCCRSLP